MLKFAKDANGNLQYLRILKTQEKPAPPPPQWADTDGRGGPFRRVYCRVFSNMGTCYVLKKAEAWIVEAL